MNQHARKEAGEPRIGLARLPMRTILLACLAAAILIPVPFASQTAPAVKAISQAAADSCDAKVKRMESIDAAKNPAGRQMTRFTEAEWNSYLALRLSPNYHPSLRDIQLKFEEARLRAFARIDFDRLNFTSTQAVTGLIRSLLAGVHSLEVSGTLASDAGKATFQLDEARFDSISLPNVLVTEILGAVGRRQVPPFDPTQPNALPYHISKIEVHSGFLTVYQ